MHFKTKLFLFLFFLGLEVNAQDFDQIRKQLQNKYDYIHQYKNGFAIARTLKQKYTVLDSTGKELFKPKYNYINNFNNLNFAEAGIEKNGKMLRGFINIYGEIVFPIKYENIYQIYANRIRVTFNGKDGVVNLKDEIIIPFQYDYVTGSNDSAFIVGNKEIYQFLSFNGKALNTEKYKYADRFFKNAANVIDLYNNSFLINNKGARLSYSFKNATIVSYNENNIIVKNNSNKYGLFDYTGKVLIPFSYNQIEYLENYVKVKKNKKIGIVDYYNNIKIPIKYKYLFINYQLENTYTVVEDSLYGVINILNKTILPTKYKYLHYNTMHHFIVINQQNLFGIYDSLGKSIIKEDFKIFNSNESIFFGERNNQSVIVNVMDTAKNIFMDTSIKFQQTNRFDYLFEKRNFIFQPFVQNKKYGLLNENGEIVIPALYDNIHQYTNYIYKIELNGKWGIFSNKNKILKPIVYDNIVWNKEILILKQKNKKNEIFGLFNDEME